MDDLIERARSFGTKAHARINHLRKYTFQPYDIHLQAVARRVASVCDDPAMIAAAWLHDTVEDTPATFEDLEREFGCDVAALVKELTDVSKPSDGNRTVRKAIDRQHLSTVSPRAKTIKLADIIDNCVDICSHDPVFGRIYLEEAKALLEILREGDPRLHREAEETLAKCSSEHVDARSEKRAAEAPHTGEPPHPMLLSERHGLRIFTEAFTARDILEPMPSFDAEACQRLFCEASLRPDAPIIGIRTAGHLTGYLLREDLAGDALPPVRAIEPPQKVELDVSLTDVVHTLTLYTCCFVTLNGTVIGTITRKDMEKPVVRMWLFGIIMLFEMLVVKQIRDKWPDESWTKLVSAGRLEKAKALQEERRRRGLKADLLDSMQFSDKFQILLHDPDFGTLTGFGSAAAAKRALKDLESLRNNLAHGQDIATPDWSPIVRLAHRIQHVFSTPSA